MNLVHFHLKPSRALLEGSEGRVWLRAPGSGDGDVDAHWLDWWRRCGLLCKRDSPDAGRTGTGSLQLFGRAAAIREDVMCGNAWTNREGWAGACWLFWIVVPLRTCVLPLVQQGASSVRTQVLLRHGLTLNGRTMEIQLLMSLKWHEKFQYNKVNFSISLYMWKWKVLNSYKAVQMFSWWSCMTIPWSSSYWSSAHSKESQLLVGLTQKPTSPSTWGSVGSDIPCKGSERVNQILPLLLTKSS